MKPQAAVDLSREVNLELRRIRDEAFRSQAARLVAGIAAREELERDRLRHLVTSERLRARVLEAAPPSGERGP